jgi:hypothetical protein
MAGRKGDVHMACAADKNASTSIWPSWRTTQFEQKPAKDSDRALSLKDFKDISVSRLLHLVKSAGLINK